LNTRALLSPIAFVFSRSHPAIQLNLRFLQLTITASSLDHPVAVLFWQRDRASMGVR
jgi:hypothetical protein